jgi:hypothetical protein
MKAKAVSPPKKKSASTAKKKPAPQSEKKPVIVNQVMDFVTDAFKGRRIAYFVLGTERTKDGAFIVCVAIEGDAGFYKMDLEWKCSFIKAKAQAEEMNVKIGLTQEEVEEIILSTMLPPIYQ